MQNGPSSNAGFDRSFLDKGSESFGASEIIENADVQKQLEAQKQARIKAKENESASREQEEEAADELLGLFEDGGDEDEILDMFEKAEDGGSDESKSSEVDVDLSNEIDLDMFTDVPSDSTENLDGDDEAEQIIVESGENTIVLDSSDPLLVEDDILSDIEDDEKKDVIDSYKGKLSSLQESGKSKTETITLLLTEFADKPELEDQMAILKKFQNAVKLPESENIPETDQAVITQLFEEGDYSFDKTGIDSFARTIESDETLSVETKKHVLGRLGVEMTVKTGKELNDTLDTVAIDPKTGKETPVFTKDNPVRLQTGIDAYVNEKGERVITVPGKDTAIVVRDINGLEDNGARKMIKLALFINNMRPEEAFLLTGERQLGETDNVYSEETIRKAEFVMNALMPNRVTDANYIPQESDMGYFRDAMNALTHEKSMGWREIQADLEAVGVIHAPGELNRDNIKKIGSYLRENDYLQNQSSQYHGDNAFDTLKEKFGKKESE